MTVETLNQKAQHFNDEEAYSVEYVAWKAITNIQTPKKIFFNTFSVSLLLCAILQENSYLHAA